MPADLTLYAGALLIFASRRWKVTAVDHDHKIIEAVPASGGRPPRFSGGIAGVHERVRAEMRSVLASDQVPPYLSGTAAGLLSEARAAYARYQLTDCSILQAGLHTLLLPWAGSRSAITLTAQLCAAGLDASNDGLIITVASIAADRVREYLQILVTADQRIQLRWPKQLPIRQAPSTTSGSMTIFWPLTTLAEPSTPTVPGELRKPSSRTGCGPQLRGRLLDELLAKSGTDHRGGPDARLLLSAPPGTCPPGTGRRRWTTSLVSGPDWPSPTRATGTWPPSPARPPPRSARLRPAKAPATGGWPAAAARPKPWWPREHPAEGLPQAAVQPGHPLSGSRRGLLRAPARHPPPDLPPRRQARRPRLRRHPLPPSRTRSGPDRHHPGGLTHTAARRPRQVRASRGPLPRAQIRSYFRVSP